MIRAYLFALDPTDAQVEAFRTDDFRGLRLLKRRLGDRFRAGFVLYCGTQSLAFGDRLTCLPISALWTTSAPRRTSGPLSLR